MPAFHEAAKLLLLRAASGHRALQGLRWRQHGLGMIQAEFSEALRVHIWHPRLRTLPVSSFEPGSSFREVHDHRFDLTSAVIVGEIIDVPFWAEPWDQKTEMTPGEPWSRWRRTKAWEILHAKIQPGARAQGCSTATEHEPLGDYGACPKTERESSWPRYPAGSVYTIPRREFHTTRLNPEVGEGLAITVVHRDNFDERLARVLGSEEEARWSAIVPEDARSGALREWVLQEAGDALNNLRG